MVKYKSFFIIFKGLSLKQVKPFFWEGEGSNLRDSKVKSFKISQYFF